MKNLFLRFAFPAAFLCLFLSFRFTNFHQYEFLVQEDGVLEYAQFVLYVFAALVIFRKLSTEKKLWQSRIPAVVLFCVGCALIAIGLEEISWGQRIFSIQTPDYFTVNNVQQELTFHNLRFAQQYLHGAYILGGIVGGILLPWFMSTQKNRTRSTRARWWGVSLYFLPVSCVYLLLGVFPPESISGPSVLGMIWRDQEIVETLMASGFLYLVLLLDTPTVSFLLRRMQDLPLRVR